MSVSDTSASARIRQIKANAIRASGGPYADASTLTATIGSTCCQTACACAIPVFTVTDPPDASGVPGGTYFQLATVTDATPECNTPIGLDITGISPPDAAPFVTPTSAAPPNATIGVIVSDTWSSANIEFDAVFLAIVCGVPTPVGVSHHFTLEF